LINSTELQRILNGTSTLLAAGFCERWPKACAMGLRWLRPAAFDYGKKLAANERLYNQCPT
jgi:hypothetical protein